MPTNIVVTDLDATLADARHRDHLAAIGSKVHHDWIEYSKACGDDALIEGAVAAVKLLSAHYPLFIISARNAEAQGETEWWLARHGIRYDGLRLRRAEDEQVNSLYKVKHIQFLRKLGLNPVLMLEDNAEVAAAVSAIGVPVLRVHPGYDDAIGVRTAEG